MRPGREQPTLDGVSPRWTRRAVLWALLATASLYVALPMLERFSPEPEPEYTVRELQRDIPPPLREPPPPPEDPPPVPEESVEPPEWQDPSPPPPSAPQALPLDLRPTLDSVSGDFRNLFTWEGEGLAGDFDSAIFEVADLDQPPQPLNRLNPVYPPRARMRRIEGYVTVEFVVNPDGEVSDVQIMEQEPGDLFAASVEQAVRRWRFQPGTRGGEAVPARVRQRIDFTLD